MVNIRQLHFPRSLDGVLGGVMNGNRKLVLLKISFFVKHKKPCWSRTGLKTRPST